MRFNLHLSKSQAGACDLLCGLDLDGWLLAEDVLAPYVAYLHGVLADEARFERGWSRWSLQLQAFFERAAAREAALVLAPSNYSAEQIARLYGIAAPRIRMVPPGFDVERWQKALASAAPAAPAAPVILCVGHMYPRKNHAGLLRAVATLRSRIPDFGVRIVGDGPEKPRLLHLAAELDLGGKVEFPGHLPFASLVEEFAHCDIFCLPSLQEGFGMVFAEAMTAGKPIVACNAGATPEVVIHGENGLLVPPGDDAALSDALATLLADPALRARLGDSNRKEAGRRFGLELAAERFMEAVSPLV
jgi:glycosyltransferase involved in cell wall biosynthesis